MEFRILTIVLAALLDLQLLFCTRISFANRLTLQPHPAKVFRVLYDQVVNVNLDLTPFYNAAEIIVSNDTCELSSNTSAPKSCNRAPCPMGEALHLKASCLYRQDEGVDRSDLLIEGPFPVRRLGDYD